MRKLVAIGVLGLGMVAGLAAPVLAYDDNEMPPGLEKFSRGVVNIATGVPDEVIAHTVGMTTEYGEDTAGGFVASAMTGAFVGLFWGVARIGSGIVDVFTFPIPFNDNEPLVQPDHHV
jgi:putative exosortase-associated protein (TIGR04073 family)